MAKRQQITAEERTDKPAKVRAQGQIPAVIYGHGRKSESIKVSSKEFSAVLKSAGTTSLVDVAIGGQAYPALIRETQRHPLRDDVTHVDFYQVRMDEEIEANVPLNFSGISPAVKDLGGVLVKNMDELEIRALPQNLPHDINIDISGLDDFEKVIRVSDIKLPEGVVAQVEGDVVVALVQAPRSEAELESLSEEVTEDVSQVEGVEKKEAGEDGDAETPEGEKSDDQPAEKKE